jgi:protein-arginine kinase
LPTRIRKVSTTKAVADFPPDEAAMIKSTRIRVGRNLAGFSFGPVQYKAQTRADIESKVTQALSKFDGEDLEDQ